jgi:hypothetical protein
MSCVRVRAGRAVTMESVAAEQSAEALALTRKLLRDMILRALLP